jgi:hypothetical protein
MIGFLFAAACICAVCFSDDISTDIACALGGGLFVLILCLIGVL